MSPIEAVDRIKHLAEAVYMLADHLDDQAPALQAVALAIIEQAELVIAPQ